MKRSTLILALLVPLSSLCIYCCTKDDPVLPDIIQDGQDSTFDNIVNGSFEIDGRNRHYKVYLPENYSNTSDLPLMIYLHAYDWNPNRGMDYTQMNLVADTSGFILVCPSAINNRWNSGVGDNPIWPAPEVDDVGFINALIDTLNENFSIDPKRIYACGFSNGGFMSHKLACQLSHRIAAIASVGGIISAGTVEKCNSQRAMPVLQIHGTLDNTVPINGTSGWYSVDETMSFWSELNGCVKVDTIQVPDIVLSDGCTIQKIIYSNSNRKIKAIYFKVEKGGHSWPSATADYSWSGNRNLDINASVEIWNFLKNYKLDQ
jgi:polyhydroxybutyrate depolymerase